MKNLRILIRKLIAEAVKVKHFNNRVFDRLQSEYSTFSNEKENIKELVLEMTNYLSTITFTGQENIAIRLFRGNYYVYNKILESGEIEHSEGTYIYVIIRGNDLETVVFGSQSYKASNVEFIFDFKQIKSYIEQEKNGKRELTRNDIIKLSKSSNFHNKKEIVPIEKNNINLRDIKIDGVNYVVNITNGIMIQKNNLNKKIDLNTNLNSFSKENQEKILNLFEGKLYFRRNFPK